MNDEFARQSALQAAPKIQLKDMKQIDGLSVLPECQLIPEPLPI